MCTLIKKFDAIEQQYFCFSETCLVAFISHLPFKHKLERKTKYYVTYTSKRCIYCKQKVHVHLELQIISVHLVSVQFYQTVSYEITVVQIKLQSNITSVTNNVIHKNNH